LRGLNNPPEQTGRSVSLSRPDNAMVFGGLQGKYPLNKCAI